MRLALLAVAVTVLAACAAAGSGGFPSGSPPAANLLVIAAGTTFPPQLVPASSIPLTNVLDITLSKGSPFSGFVASSAGVPVNCTVDISMQGAGIDTVITVPNGQFTLNLAKGTYDVGITPNSEIANNKKVPPYTFQNIVVSSDGKSVSYNFPMQPGFAVSGSLSVGGSEQLADDWTIYAQDTAGIQSSTIGTSNATGGFQIYVVNSGSWLVTAVPPAGSTLPVVTTLVSLSPTDNQLLLDVPALPAPFTVTGTVSGSAGDAAPAGGFGAITVRAVGVIPSTTNTALSMTIDTSVETNTAGVFSFTDSLIPGTYTFYVEPGISFPFSQVVVPGLTVGSSLAIPPSATVLAPKISLSGSVLGLETGAAAANAEIDFSAADGTLYQFPDLTDGNGNYQLTVNQGVYNVTIIPTGNSGLVRSVTNQAVSSGSSPLGFNLAGGQIVSGRVFQSDGVTPAAGATVTAVDASGQPTGSQQSITTANGSWELTLPVAQPAPMQTVP